MPRVHSGCAPSGYDDGKTVQLCSRSLYLVIVVFYQCEVFPAHESGAHAKREVHPGFEPGLLEGDSQSKSRVIATTLMNQLVNAAIVIC